jgi:hypothetical protein
MEILFLLPFFIMSGVASFMIIRLWNSMTRPRIHPELIDVKTGDPLLVFRFTDEDLEQLQQRVFQQKMNELFEEPSTYEDENDDED